MKKLLTIIILFFISIFVYSQNTVRGTFSGISHQKIKLVGFKGFDTYVIDSIQSNEKGEFKLSYSEKDYGVGYLLSANGKSFTIILDHQETIQLKGETLDFPQTISVLAGKQNIFLEQYASEHQRREQAMSAWDYLGKIYQNDTLFYYQNIPKKAIEREKQRIKAEDSLFLTNLASESYVSWYLPLRKLVSSVSTIAQYRTEEIPTAIAFFRAIDYTDLRLHKSGLLSSAIVSHFWLLENSGRSLDSVYKEMESSIDSILETLWDEQQKLNEISEYLFKLLEKRSLFRASEYLSLKLLNKKHCTLNQDLSAQLESYRAMKKGNIAPDFIFPTDFLAPGYEAAKKPKKLSDIESKYTVVVFGASWCPQCPPELSQIAGFYEKWKRQKLEVVFISLDDDPSTFKSFSSIFPFISICDYGKWESPIVEKYHVFGTPTLYLLNQNREIILRPHSASQLDAWVDWYLIKGNQ